MIRKGYARVTNVRAPKSTLLASKRHLKRRGIPSQVHNGFLYAPKKFQKQLRGY